MSQNSWSKETGICVIYINLTIRNPWSDRFEIVSSWGQKIFKHKAWEIEIYRSLLLLAQENGDVEFYNFQRVKFNNFNKMMGEYKREIE